MPTDINIELKTAEVAPIGLEITYAAARTINLELATPQAKIIKIDFGNIGPKGDEGSNGLSAYQIAVNNGFIGTEQEWLDSLQGEDGVDATGSFTHMQSVPSAVWTINHNLGFKPNILVENSAHDTVIGQIEHNNNNQATITFSAAFAGEAYCS